MLRLLGRKTSGNVQKVLFLLEEAGIPYERQDYGRTFQNTMTPDYLVLNPTSKVPTLVDGDVVVWESNTILRYLAALHAPGLAGATPAEKTQVERWMDFVLAAVNPGYLAAFKGAKLAPAERAPGYGEAVADLIAQLKILDGHLAGQSFLALGRLTLADIALGPIIARCLAFPLDRPAMPALEAWFAGIASRPAFKVATA